MIAPGQTSLQVRDVIDRLDPSVITERIAKTCSRSTLQIDTTSMIIPDFQGNTQERVFHAEMPALHVNLSPEERHVILLQHDTYLSSMIDTYFKNEDYTLIYATTSVHAQQNSIPASESQEYEAELPVADMMHSGELRRSLARRKEGLTSNQTVVDGPLFDKYQFLSPGAYSHSWKFDRTNRLFRHFHGSLCRLDPPLYSLRWHFRIIEPGSHLRCIQQRAGSIIWEKAGIA